jgi:hypothetical protein
MRDVLYVRWVLALSFAGTLFAGYLSATKLLTDTCAFNEPCPYFIGYPSCWYGFAMFFAMLLVIIAAAARKVTIAKAVVWESWISFAGILFAGYFTVEELIGFLAGGVVRYTLILPTCAYGLIFYVAIFVLSRMKAGRSASGT